MPNSETPQAPQQLPPEHFIPVSTRENYAQVARDAAKVNGGTAKDAMGELAAQFAKQHETDPLAGYDHLAAWAKDYDPAQDDPIDPAAAARSRVIESARRDPYQAYLGSPAALAAADEAIAARDAFADPGPQSGVVPNPGPVPTDA